MVLFGEQGFLLENYIKDITLNEQTTMKSTQGDGIRHQTDHLKLIKTLKVKELPLSYKVNPTYQTVRGMRQSLQCPASVLYFSSEVPKAN